MKALINTSFIILLFALSCSPARQSADSEDHGQRIAPKASQTKSNPAVSEEEKPPVESPPPLSGVLGRPQVCADVLDKFLDPKLYALRADDFRKNFVLKKDLTSASKSGAFPAIVLSKKDNKIQFLKVFPKIRNKANSAEIRKDPSYLEIFQTCRMAKFQTHENLPKDISASKFYVDVYKIGFLPVLNPFSESDEDSQSFYPYMLSEAVDNITLTEFATKPIEALNKLGFNLFTAPKMVLESILLQIIVALKNPYSKLELTHNDLHTGNILLSSKEEANFAIDYAGRKLQLNGPLVKIIDLGLAESSKFRQKSTANFILWIRNRPFIEELNTFIKAARGDDNLPSYWTQFRIGQASNNQDIRMINLMLEALKPILDSRGSTIPEGRYCEDYDDCIELMSTWWK